MSLSKIIKHGIELVLSDPISTHQRVDGATRAKEVSHQADLIHELVPDIPSHRSYKGRSLQETSIGQSHSNQGMLDSPGAAQRRRSPSAYSPMVAEEGISTPKLFRLHCWETWQLFEDEERLCNIQLSHQGRSDADFVWTTTGTWIAGGKGAVPPCKDCLEEFWGWCPYQIELIDYDYDSYTIWVLPKRGSRSRPWILLAAQAEDRSIHYLVAEPTSQYQAVEMEGVNLLWDGCQYEADCRLVELEYQEVAKFQTGAALCEWATQRKEDFTFDEVVGICERLRGTDRRLLRSLSQPRTGVNLDGRVQRRKNNSVSESVSTRSTDDTQSEGRSKVEDVQPTAYCDEQFDDGASVSQDIREESTISSSTTSSFSGSDSDRSPGLGQYSMEYGRDQFDLDTRFDSDVRWNSDDEPNTSGEELSSSSDEGLPSRPKKRQRVCASSPTRRSNRLSRFASGGAVCYKCWQDSILGPGPLEYDGYWCKHINMHIKYADSQR